MKSLTSYLNLFLSLLILLSATAHASEALPKPQVQSDDGALAYLEKMQQAYRTLNYELLYINSLQNQVDPKHLMHGVVNGQELMYFRYLNGAMRESVQYDGKISFYEQGGQAYSLHSSRDQSVFASIAGFNYQKGLKSYDYIVVGKGRVAGKKSIAVRMVSKDEFRYSYIIWLDLETKLPLRLDTLNPANLILEQVMVVSLKVTEQPNPWLEQLSKQRAPIPIQLHADSQQSSQWALSWLPTGFKVVKDDQHMLMMQDNEPVSYVMLNDGIVTVSVYIASKKAVVDAHESVMQHGATVLYSYHKDTIEVNVVGEVPVATAKRLARSITPVQ